MYIYFALCKLKYINLEKCKVVFTPTDLQLTLLSLHLRGVMRAQESLGAAKLALA